MAGISHDGQDSQTGMADAANLGLIRPPIVYLSSIVVGVLLHFAWPARLVPPSLSARPPDSRMRSESVETASGV